MTSSSSSSRRRRLRQINSEIDPLSKRQKLITEKEIALYIAKKEVRKKVLKLAKKLKSEIPELFVWRKKIRRDVARNGVVPLLLDGEYYSVKRLRETMAQMEKLNRIWEERFLQKAQRREEMAARSRARSESDEWEKKEREFDLNQTKIRSELNQARINEQQSSSDQHDNHDDEEEEDGLIRPKYMTRVHTGFDWNKYNRTHYDHENPPPKTVQGYKFNIFYPDLVVDRSNAAPIYAVEKDENSDETCIIRFHAGPPYADVAFRIASGEWDHSSRNGFKCTFDDNGVLRLYFNFKRFRYRR